MFFIWAVVIGLAGCSPSGRQNPKVDRSQLPQGTYGYDLAFLEAHRIGVIELRDEATGASVAVCPALQGRVMTSSAGGDNGISFGWINYKLIESGKVSSQFNPYGGEERFWLGPEGGPFSIYFEKGKEQVFENWVVPPVLDTESYEVKESASRSVLFTKNTTLQNASGTEFQVGIERKVSLLSRDTLPTLFGVPFPASLEVVAYQTDNRISNRGEAAWTQTGGLLSVWLLCMFNPSPATTVFIPYRAAGEGVVVNDDYFGKVPSDRLIAENGTIFFRIDGKFRSKIGLPPQRAQALCGSYDSEQKVLTLLWCSLPAEPKPYVNSKWGDQDNPFAGDVINSYNDGPVADGSVMGPFYEIETSSPGAELQPGESLTHTQRVVHLHGDEAELAPIVRELFNLNLSEIAAKFQ